jgi:hypothetical protein
MIRIRLKPPQRTTSARRACPTEPDAPKITAVLLAIFFSNRKVNTLWQYLTHGFAATPGTDINPAMKLVGEVPLCGKFMKFRFWPGSDL